MRSDGSYGTTLDQIGHMEDVRFTEGSKGREADKGCHICLLGASLSRVQTGKVCHLTGRRTLDLFPRQSAGHGVIARLHRVPGRIVWGEGMDVTTLLEAVKGNTSKHEHYEEKTTVSCKLVPGCTHSRHRMARYHTRYTGRLRRSGTLARRSGYSSSGPVSSYGA